MLPPRCKPTLPLVKILFIVHGRDFILSFVHESTIQNSHGWISLQLSNLLIRLLNSYLHIYQLLHLLCRRCYRRLIRVPLKVLLILGLVDIHYFRLQERQSRYRYIMYLFLLLLCERFGFNLFNDFCSCLPLLNLRVAKLFSHHQHLHQFVKIHFPIFFIDVVLHAKQLSLLIL